MPETLDGVPIFKTVPYHIDVNGKPVVNTTVVTSSIKTQLESSLTTQDVGMGITVGNTSYLWNGTSFDTISISGAALVTDGIESASTTMLTDAITTGTAASTQLTGAGLKSKCRYSATLGANDTIAATATVKIYGSDVVMASATAFEKFEIGTLSLSGTGVTNNDTVADIDAVHVDEHYWTYIWMEVTALTGAGAKVQGRRVV